MRDFSKSVESLGTKSFATLDKNRHRVSSFLNISTYLVLFSAFYAKPSCLCSGSPNSIKRDADAKTILSIRSCLGSNEAVCELSSNIDLVASLMTACACADLATGSVSSAKQLAVVMDACDCCWLLNAYEKVVNISYW